MNHGQKSEEKDQVLRYPNRCRMTVFISTLK